jgi:hypothetical protein
MTENNLDSPSLQDAFKDTQCYTYDVIMRVQVLAPSKEIADEKLDKDGGYVSKRDVLFVKSTKIHTENKSLNEEETEDI